MLLPERKFFRFTITVRVAFANIPKVIVVIQYGITNNLVDFKFESISKEFTWGRPCHTIIGDDVSERFWEGKSLKRFANIGKVNSFMSLIMLKKPRATSIPKPSTEIFGVERTYNNIPRVNGCIIQNRPIKILIDLQPFISIHTKNPITPMVSF